ncbi:MAG: MATE family efflux transporter [Bacteroidales bacterium]
MKPKKYSFKNYIPLFIYYRNKFKYLLSEIGNSLKSNDLDYTSIRLGKAMYLLAIPMVLEMIMESVFAITDIFFVSKLGADAIATVGLTESLLTIIYAIGFGLSMATTAMVSRRIGEKNPEQARNIAFQAIITGSAISLLISLAGIFYSKDMLMMMGANNRIVNEMSGYTTLMISSNIVIMLLFINNAIFRSAGDAVVSMRVLWLANLINLVLDPLLIFGIGPFPELGVMGAAVATTIGRGTGVLYQFYLYAQGNARIKLVRKELSVDIQTIVSLIRLSMGGIGQNIIATSSWIGLMRIVSVFGSNVLAGYTIAIRIVVFALLPSWGLSNAASTLVGQNLGAGKPERAEKAVWAAGRINMILMGLIGVFFVLMPDMLIRLFTSDIDIIHNGIKALRIVSFGFVFYGLGMVLMNAINGAGDTITPTKLNFLCFWIIEIPLAYLLALYWEWNQSGVFYAIVIAESALCLISLWWFRQGKWKMVEV